MRVDPESFAGDDGAASVGRGRVVGSSGKWPLRFEYDWPRVRYATDGSARSSCIIRSMLDVSSTVSWAARSAGDTRAWLSARPCISVSTRDSSRDAVVRAVA